MIEILEEITKIPCINGSEYVFSRYLKAYFEEKGFSVTVDRGNNVLVQKDPDLRPQTLLFTPMDSPGYICLCQESSFAYLTATSKAVKELKNVDQVIDFSGKIHSLEKAESESDPLFIKSESNTVGSAFCLTSDFSIEKDFVMGRYAARYACIALLMKLTEAVQTPKVSFCFTAGFNSGSKAESNVLARVKADQAILLGYCNENGDLPILALKDGKNFASSELSEKFSKCCKQLEISVLTKVFDQAITAAERTLYHGGNILSLAIPCSEELSANEKVSLRAATELFTGLKSFLN